MDAFACGNDPALEIAKDEARKRKWYGELIELLDLMRAGQTAFRGLDQPTEKTKV